MLPIKKILAIKNGYFALPETLLLLSSVVMAGFIIILLGQDVFGRPIQCQMIPEASMQDKDMIERECLNGEVVIDNNFNSFLNGALERPRREVI